MSVDRLSKQTGPAPRASSSMAVDRETDAKKSPTFTSLTRSASLARSVSVEPLQRIRPVMWPALAARPTRQQHHHHRQPPRLPARPKPRHRSAPTLQVHDSRTLPATYQTELVSKPMYAILVEHARKHRQELMLLVEMNPASQANFSLHQTAHKYQDHLSLLHMALGDAIRSDAHPDTVFISTAAARLPDSWLQESGPAFDDCRRLGGPVASNLSHAGTAPSRLGAFEVYMVWKPPSGKPPHVEQLFSKLFSRCWPRADLIVKRLCEKCYIKAEMAVRQGRLELAQSMQLKGPALRAVLDEMSTRSCWAELQVHPTAVAAIKLLADFESRASQILADDSLTDALKVNDQAAFVEVVKQHLPNCTPEVEALVRSKMAEVADAKLRLVISKGDKAALEAACASAVFEPAKTLLQTCHESMYREVTEKLDEVCSAENELKRAIDRGEASGIAEALERVSHQWSPQLQEMAKEKLQIIRAADEALTTAPDKATLDIAIKTHLSQCSPSVSDALRPIIAKVSDLALCAALENGDALALQAAASQHLEGCSPDVAQTVKATLIAVEVTETALMAAMSRGEATDIVHAIEAVDPIMSPFLRSQAKDKASAVLVMDTQLRALIAGEDRIALQEAAQQWAASCSPSVMEQGRERITALCDAALRAVLATGDRAALEVKAAENIAYCSAAVAQDVGEKLHQVRYMEEALYRAVSRGEAAEITAVLEAMDPVFSSAMVADARTRLENTMAADKQMIEAMSTGDRLTIDTAAPKLLPHCSPSVANWVKQTIMQHADAALCEVLQTGDMEALLDVAAVHFVSCSPGIAREVEMTVDRVKRAEKAMHSAMESGEYIHMVQALKAIEGKWNPALLAEAEQRASLTNTADKALLNAMAMLHELPKAKKEDKRMILNNFQDVLKAWRKTASPGVSVEARGKLKELEPEINRLKQKA